MRCRVPRQLQRSWDLRHREQNLSLFLRMGWDVLRGAKILRVRDGERDGTVERVNILIILLIHGSQFGVLGFILFIFFFQMERRVRCERYD